MHGRRIVLLYNQKSHISIPYPPQSPCVLRPQNLRKNFFWIYPKILDGNNIEPPNSENHEYMQIVI